MFDGQDMMALLVFELGHFSVHVTQSLRRGIGIGNIELDLSSSEQGHLDIFRFS